MRRFEKSLQYMNIEHSLASKLLSINAIKLSPSDPFVWASGLRSPIYCDNRISLSYPEVRTMIKNGFVKAVRDKDYNPDAIVGVATAGIPHGALLADALNLPFAYVRSKAKEHGRQNQIEGELRDGMTVILTEDLISTGGSALKVVKVLRELNIEVLNVFSIFTYNLGEASENFSKENCTYHSLTNYPALLEFTKKSGHLTESEYSTLKEWYLSPKVWSEKFQQQNK